MKTIKFRVRNPIKWLSPLIVTVYLIGVVLLVIQNYDFFHMLTWGSGPLLMMALLPVLAPMLLLVWLLDPARQVRMGEGRLVLAQGDQVLAQISYPEIAHIRLTGPQHDLEVFDRTGARRIHIESAVFWRGIKAGSATVAIVDFMRTQLPHMANSVEKRRGQNTYVERYIDFPPQPAYQQSPAQPAWQEPQGQSGWQQPQGQSGWQQPQGQSGWR